MIVFEFDEFLRDFLVVFIEIVFGDNVLRRRKKRVKDCEMVVFSGNKVFIVLKKRKERVNVGEMVVFSGIKVVFIVDVLKKRKRVSDCEMIVFNGVVFKEEKNYFLFDIFNVDVIN